LAELQQLLNQSPDQIIIIDVRSPEEYAEKHIPGAINIPLGELESRSKELSEQALIITACGKGGGRSAEAAAILKQQGFSKAFFLCGGTVGWYESASGEK
jgi:rhodanese-related sulfurtransferase